MNERIKFLRKEILGLTQKEFADKIGTAGNNIACYETGKSTPSNAIIASICKTFNVSEQWLRDGVGEPLIPVTHNQQIHSWIDDVMADNNDSLRKKVLEVLSRSTPEFWKELEKML